ncbi:MAG: glycerol-3-phosphate responsive antiterminator [Christensenellales bacterium]
MGVAAELKKSGIVAAVKDEAAFRQALSSPARVIFLLKSDLMTVGDTVRRAHVSDKKILLHIDLMDGIGKDEAAIRYVVERLKPDGIISTRPNIVKCAKSAGIFTVLRVFLIDSQGLSSALVYADKICPDSVEIMPGLLPEMVGKFTADSRSVIVGGLISTREEAERGLRAGAVAASTSNPQLWDLSGKISV